MQISPPTGRLIIIIIILEQLSAGGAREQQAVDGLAHAGPKICMAGRKMISLEGLALNYSSRTAPEHARRAAAGTTGVCLVRAAGADLLIGPHVGPDRGDGLAGGPKWISPAGNHSRRGTPVGLSTTRRESRANLPTGLVKMKSKQYRGPGSEPIRSSRRRTPPVGRRIWTYLAHKLSRNWAIGRPRCL